MSTLAPVRVANDVLSGFCAQILQTLNVSLENANLTTAVLVKADLRGVYSHGVGRMRRYVSGIQAGTILPQAEATVVKETACTALLDAGGGLGQPAGWSGMTSALMKAKTHGIGIATVANSNHFGIAGYYSMMALQWDMIGLAFTNSAPLLVPTFGRDALLGTNPISMAVPSAAAPFVLDMATAIVPRGKLEVAAREGKPIPPGWATDENGLPTTDPLRVIQNLNQRLGGGLLPLGGVGEEMGGHKGYGLAAMVDILTGVLSGSGYLGKVYPQSPDGKPLPANVAHTFMAINVAMFRDLMEFKADMADFMQILRQSAKAADASRIYLAGEKEAELENEQLTHGIKLTAKVVEDLRQLGQELGVGCSF